MVFRLHYKYHYTLNSLSLFWLAESVQWIFEISACDLISADYTITRQGHSRSRVIMSSSHALCYLPLVKEQKHDFYFFHSMYNKTIIRFGFCDIQNNQGLGKGYQLKPKAEADNPYLNLDYSGYHKNLIQWLFINQVYISTHYGSIFFD